jgi:II/X family phage/plasmid replication protein
VIFNHGGSHAGQTTHHQTSCAQLPAELLGTALAWKMGKDLPRMMKRATYYRHRRKLLNEHGIDISQPCKVVELATRIKVREIEVMPMVAPDWYWERTGTGI